jgi:hypothetical protein
LRSYGGDIIIFASVINVNAPIDSRVYVNHDLVETLFSPPNPTWVNPYGSRGGQENTWVKINTEHGRPHPNYVNSFKDYFLSCPECNGDTRFPELPSGLAAASTVLFGGNTPRLDGQSPPDDNLNYTALRSGNIYLFAKTIVINPKLNNPTNLNAVQNCGEKISVPFAINASGSMGGKGGPGSVSSCVTSAGGHFDCVSSAYTMTGGTSGNGGRGGDAGDVYIAALDKIPNNALRSLISVNGGLPGSNEKLITGAAAGPNAVTGDRCSFRPSGQLYVGAAQGTNGKLTINQMSSSAALSEVASLLISEDARIDHDSYTFLQLARSDKSISSTSLTSALTEYLRESLVKTEQRYIDDLDRTFALQQADKGEYLPELLTDSRDATFTYLPEQQAPLLRELSKYGDANGVLSYMTASNGLFAVDSRDTAYQQMVNGTLHLDLSKIHVDLTEIKDEVRQLNSKFFEFISRDQLASYQNQIASLQTQITNAEAEAKKAADSNSGLLVLVTALKDLADSTSTFASGLMSGNYESAAGALRKGVEAFGSVQKIMQSPVANQAGLEGLRQQLHLLSDDYQRFQLTLIQDRASYTAREYSDLSAILDARATVRDSLVNSALLTPQLTKTALISYFADPAKNTGNLRNNLAALKSYLQTQQGFVNIYKFDWGCSQKNSCKKLDASIEERELATELQVGGRSRTVTLYRIAPNTAATLRVFTQAPVKISEQKPKHKPGGTTTQVVIAVIVILIVIGVIVAVIILRRHQPIGGK